MSALRLHTAGAACLLASACTFAPPGLDAERERAASFGVAYETPFEHRALPELSAAPALDELWARTLSSSGELEMRWREWRAALEAVVRESSAPNTNLALDLEHELTQTGLDAWDRTRVTFGFDPMQSLWGPQKMRAAGEVALAEARTRGERFRAARAALKRELVETWIGWLAARDEHAALSTSLELRRLELESLVSAVAAQGGSAELFAARVEILRLEDERARAEARTEELAATLNGLLARDPLAPLAPPTKWPRRTVDAARLELGQLLELARLHDPERASAASEVGLRESEIERAELEGNLDFSPFAGFLGSLETFIGASLSIPVNRTRLESLLREARERREAARAGQRELAFTRDAALAVAQRAWRDAERTQRLLEGELVPLARAATDNARARLASGGASSLEWIAARRTELELLRAEIDARAERERELARIEELVGIDLESFAVEIDPAEVPQ